MIKFSLVIPCFNEAKNLPLLVDKCLKLAASCDCEILIVNNGSSDDTKIVLTNLLKDFDKIRLINIDTNIGYGHGIIEGLKQTKGEILGWTHADLQTDPLDCLSALKFFNDKEAVFVKGRRRGRSFLDNLFTIGMSIFESILLKKWMWDINAQPTMFNREFFEDWKNMPNDFSLDLYSYFNAKSSNINVERVPVYFRKRAHGVSNWNNGFFSRYKFI